MYYTHIFVVFLQKLMYTMFNLEDLVIRGGIRNIMNQLENLVVTDIQDLFSISHPRGRTLKMQNRASFGISFCISGQITYTHNGTQVISDYSHAIIFPQNATYSLRCDKAGIFTVINFSCDNSFCLDEFIRIPLRNPEIYLSLFHHLSTDFGQKNTHAKSMSILYDIIHHLTKEYFSKENPLASTMTFLEKHIENPELNNQLLANHANLSEVYFRELFKEIYNTTPKQYILEQRLQKAKSLLANGVESITAISESCGFSSIYHFCHSFKTNTQMTPTEYRELYRRQEI